MAGSVCGVFRCGRTRRRNRPGAQLAGPGGQDVFQRLCNTEPAKPVPWIFRIQEKILNGWSERSERPVALPTAAARLTSRYTPRIACRGLRSRSYRHRPNRYGHRLISLPQQAPALASGLPESDRGRTAVNVYVLAR